MIKTLSIIFTVIQTTIFIGCVGKANSISKITSDSVTISNPHRALLDDLIDWAPDSETNCASTALYADGRIDDLMHVDPDELNQFVLPYCYERVSVQDGPILVVGFGTSQDKIDYRRLLHVFHVSSDGKALNKAGATNQEPFKMGALEDFKNMDSYFEAMADAMHQPVDGEVEFYRFKKDVRCPLNNYGASLQMYVKEPLFFETQGPILSKFKARESDVSLQQLLPVRDLVEAHERLEARLELLSDKIFPIYQATANQHGLSFNSRMDMVKVFPLVTDPYSVEVLKEYFVLRLARKQIRMALGIRELDSLPSP